MNRFDHASALAAQGLGVCVAARSLLHDISFDVLRGQWVCLCGPNGAGKSTLLRALAGLVPIDGVVEWLGRPWGDWSAHERAIHLTWMGQAQPIPFDLSIADVVNLGRWPHTRSGLLEPKENQDAVAQALKDMGLTAMTQRGLHEVSGGECQRTLLARAMAAQTPIMLFDEPLNHLDVPHQQAWLSWLRRHVGTGATVLTVMHELNHALAADQLLILCQGRLLHQGPPGDARTREALQEAFGQSLVFHAIDTHGTAPRWVALPRSIY
ncbi:MAG: ABC transporter ATP-binding protein [Alphaproteobacteria bacterium]|nr:ABC transporter ATP-binding protein [Alphaproteobacteria bacterium]